MPGTQEGAVPVINAQGEPPQSSSDLNIPQTPSESNPQQAGSSSEASPALRALDDALSRRKRIPISEATALLSRTSPQEASDALYSAMERGEYAIDAEDNLFRVEPREHIDNRIMESVGSRSVQAFQFENPDLHEYFAEAARGLQEDLANTTRAERWRAQGVNPDTGDAETRWSGVKRDTTPQIASLLDDQRLSYDDISKAVSAIIQNHGQENYAAAKRVELVLDDMLTNGWTTVLGERVAPNEAYISAKESLPGAQLRQSGGEAATSAAEEGSVGDNGPVRLRPVV